MGLITSSFCYSSQGLDESDKAIKIIVNAAKDLCETVPLSGGTEGIQLTGDARAKLKGVLKKLADIGIEGAVKYEKSSYDGVLQKDLANIINQSTNCKMDVWNDLKDKLISSLPTDKRNKNSEALIKDQNPTELIISKISLKDYWGFDEPYVVATIKNTSSVSANNVRVSFWKETNSPIKSNDKIYKQYHSKNLQIRAGKENDFPIAPISDYVSKLKPQYKPESLINFSVLGEPKLPTKLQEELCKGKPTNCGYSTLSTGTFVVIDYETIFGDKTKKTTSFTNTFLNGTVSSYMR